MKWLRGHPVVAISTVLSIPLIVGAFVLARKEWAPVLDLAMTELRVRDVGGGHTPLVGLPGRIGDFPNQGSHPGPLIFYALAPVYRTLGSTGAALEVGMAFVSIAAIIAIAWLARRRGGVPMLLGVGVMVAAVVALYGPAVLAQPWNPYAPVLAWMVVLMATWSVLDRDPPALVLLVVFGSLAAQTHIPYVGLCGGMALFAFSVVLLRARRAAPGSVARRDALRWASIAAALGVVLWIPPVLDQLFGHGNLSTIARHFGDPPEPPVGFGEGARVLLERFDVAHLFDRPDYSRLVVAVSHRSQGVAAIGALVVGAWAACAIGSVVAQLRRVWPLHATVAVGLVLALVSTSRIFGDVWFYLTLWAISLVLLAVFAIVWTLIEWGAARRVSIDRADADREARSGPQEAGRSGRAGVIISMVAIVLLVGVVTVESVRARPPERELSATLLTLVDESGPALEDRRDSERFLVTWEDAHYIGSQGLGLLNELDRRGYDVGVTPMFAVPATRHRVFRDDEATVELRFVTGSAVAEILAADDPGVRLLARVDPRDGGARARYDDLRARLRDQLVRRGLPELADQVDISLFALSLDERLTDDEHELVVELLRLGEDSAIFEVPIGYRRA